MDTAYPVPVEKFSDNSYLSELAHNDIAVWHTIFANLTPRAKERRFTRFAFYVLYLCVSHAVSFLQRRDLPDMCASFLLPNYILLALTSLINIIINKETELTALERRHTN